MSQKDLNLKQKILKNKFNKKISVIKQIKLILKIK